MLKIKTDELIKKNEEIINFDFDASNFNSDNVTLQDEEELDEKKIGYIEKKVRNSYEYRKYITYLKNGLDITKCALMPNIDIKTSPVSLEFHHFPLNLYEICEAVAREKLRNNTSKKISYFEITEEVVKQHYLGKVGLVPLTKTLHDMVHNNKLFIPYDKILGNYQEFITEYNKFIDSDILDRINFQKQYNISKDAIDANSQKLKVVIANYNIDYKEN